MALISLDPGNLAYLNANSWELEILATRLRLLPDLETLHLTYYDFHGVSPLRLMHILATCKRLRMLMVRWYDCADTCRRMQVDRVIRHLPVRIKVFHVDPELDWGRNTYWAPYIDPDVLKLAFAENGSLHWATIRGADLQCFIAAPIFRANYLRYLRWHTYCLALASLRANRRSKIKLGVLPLLQQILSFALPLDVSRSNEVDWPAEVDDRVHPATARALKVQLADFKVSEFLGTRFAQSYTN